MTCAFRSLEKNMSYRWWNRSHAQEQGGMEDVSNLITELLRAANTRAERDSSYVDELLYRAIVEITRMRTTAGIPSVGTPRDRIIRLRDAAARDVSQAQASAALLEAADMLRDLKIVVAEGVVISLKTTAL